jgi:hypothetical protein
MTFMTSTELGTSGEILEFMKGSEFGFPSVMGDVLRHNDTISSFGSWYKQQGIRRPGIFAVKIQSTTLMPKATCLIHQLISMLLARPSIIP